MDLTALRAALRTRLRLEDMTDSSNGSLTQTEGTALVNGAMRRVWAEMVKLNPEACVRSTTMTYTAAAESVALPSSSPDLRGRPIREVSAVLTSGSTSPSDRSALTCRTMQELDNYESDGDPGVYALGLSDGTMWVRPRPTSAMVLYIKYVPAPVALSATTDVPSFLAEEFHDLIVDSAALEYLESNVDVQLQNTIGAAYQRKLRSFMVFFEDMTTQNGFRYMPARN